MMSACRYPNERRLRVAHSTGSLAGESAFTAWKFSTCGRRHQTAGTTVDVGAIRTSASLIRPVDDRPMARCCSSRDLLLNDDGEAESGGGERGAVRRTES